MATQFEATLRLKGSDETAEAFRSAAQSARRFAQEQGQASRDLRDDVNSIGRAFRGLRRTVALGGITAMLKQGVSNALDYGSALKRIGINAQASEEIMSKVGERLREQSRRILLPLNEVIAGFDAWRIASGQSVEAAMESFPLIGTAATAMGADIGTVATLAGRLRTNLKIPAEDMTRAFEMIRVAARNVDFEQFAQNFESFSEQAQILGLQGTAGLQQMAGAFLAINQHTNNAEQSFRILGEVMNKASDPTFLSERFRGGLLKVMQETVAAGGNIVDVLGQIATRGGMDEATWQRYQTQLRDTFGPDLYKLLEDTRDGLIDVRGATAAVAAEAGGLEADFKRSTTGIGADTKLLKIEFDELLTALGGLALGMDQAFGTEKQGFIRQSAQEIKALTEILGDPEKWMAEIDWEKFLALDKFKDFFRQLGRIASPAGLQEAVEGSWLGRTVARATGESYAVGPQSHEPVQGMQRGGPVAPGQPYVVGERGPELFVPRIGGRLVPDWASRGAGAALPRVQDQTQLATPTLAQTPAGEADTAALEASANMTRANTSAITDQTRQQRTLADEADRGQRSLADAITELSGWIQENTQALSQREEPRYSLLSDRAETQFGEAIRRRPSMAVTTELSPEARGLLDTIAGTESGGRDPYTQLYGGRNVQLAPGARAPGVPIRSGPNVGQTSSAYGRYQFINPTWEEQQRKIVGQRPELAQEFAQRTPRAQDIAAWNKARERYEGATGRSLQADIESGQLAAGGMRALSREWTSLPGGIEQQRRAAPFQQRLASNVERQRQVAAPAAMPAPERVAERAVMPTYDEDALAQARAARAELEKPIQIRYEHQPGESRMLRGSVRNLVDREVREASWNSYADLGMASG